MTSKDVMPMLILPQMHGFEASLILTLKLQHRRTGLAICLYQC